VVCATFRRRSGGRGFKYKCDDLAQLRKKGVVGPRTVETIHHVLGYLLRVRNELHYLQGKKADVLGFEAQERLAGSFRYRQLGSNQAVERFMRSYYLHAASAARLSDEVLEEVGRFLPEEGRRKPFFFLQRKLVGAGGILYKGSCRSRTASPSRRSRSGSSSSPIDAEVEIGPLPQARRNIQMALPAVGAAFREDREAAKLFLEILSDPFHLRETLLAMNESRFLGRYIPEFAPSTARCSGTSITSTRWTSIRSAARASWRGSRPPLPARRRRRGSTDPRVRKEPRAVPPRDPVSRYRKGEGQGHSRIGAEIVARIGARWGLAEEDVSDLVFLVEQHLLMGQRFAAGATCTTSS